MHFNLWTRELKVVEIPDLSVELVEIVRDHQAVIEISIHRATYDDDGAGGGNFYEIYVVVLPALEADDCQQARLYNALSACPAYNPEVMEPYTSQPYWQSDFSDGLCAASIWVQEMSRRYPEIVQGSLLGEAALPREVSDVPA